MDVNGWIDDDDEEDEDEMMFSTQLRYSTRSEMRLFLMDMPTYTIANGHFNKMSSRLKLEGQASKFECTENFEIWHVTIIHESNPYTGTLRLKDPQDKSTSTQSRLSKATQKEISTSPPDPVRKNVKRKQ